MKKFKIFLYYGIVLLTILALANCSQDLSVTNENNPDKDRALSRPLDVESLIGGSFKNYWNQGTHRQEPPITLSVMADEMTSSWGNFSMQEMSSEPRQDWNNFITYDADYRHVNEFPWYSNYAAISDASDGLKAIVDGMQLIDDAGEDNTMRGQAFAKFVQGVALGFVSLFFDQAFILDETIDLETDVLELRPYNEVFSKALQSLNDCIAICDANSFMLPDSWINGRALTNDELARVAHSYAARYTASVARSAEERAAADWAAIRDHIDRGITEDFTVEGDGTNSAWWFGLHLNGMHTIWVRADYKCIGPADSSGNYQAWLDTPVADRMPFMIETADRRVTGDSSHIDGTDFAFYGQPYHREDRGTYHFSYYGSYRYIDHLNNDGLTPMVEIMLAEMDLLKAEAILRIANDGAGAVELINKTRVTRGQLPPATADNIGSSTDDRALNGSVWAMLKYEKGIECFAGGVGVAFWDRRGWGDLVSGTALHFPIPAQEIEVLQMETYTFGGDKGGAAPKRLSPPLYWQDISYY